MEYNSNITLSKGRIKHFSQQVKSTEVLILKPLLLEKKKPLLFQLMHTIIKKLQNVKTNLKVITLAPTCFGSRRNHHHGTVLCLAKTTEYGFSVLVVMDVVMLWLYISLLCRRAVHSGDRNCLHFP